MGGEDTENSRGDCLQPFKCGAEEGPGGTDDDVSEDSEVSTVKGLENNEFVDITDFLPVMADGFESDISASSVGAAVAALSASSSVMSS